MADGAEHMHTDEGRDVEHREVKWQGRGRGRWAEKGPGRDLLSDEGDGVREVRAEEVHDLVGRGDLLELIKGHEESAGESFVLLERKKWHDDTLNTGNSLFPILINRSLDAVW